VKNFGYFNHIALDRYNRLYENSMFLFLRSQVVACSIDEDEVNMMMNLIIDAALEVCGFAFYQGSQALVLEVAYAVGGAVLKQQVAHYLNHYDPEEELPF
jgi:hypothetical protein